MIIDIEKVNSNLRYGSHRAYVISAAYRDGANGLDDTETGWIDTHESYAVVTAEGPVSALLAYLKARPDLAEHAQLNWALTKEMQRVWLVRRAVEALETTKIITSQSVKKTSEGGNYYIFD